MVSHDRFAAKLQARDRDGRSGKNREHDDHSCGHRDNANYLKSDQDGEPYEVTRFVMRGDMTGLLYDTPVE